MSTTTSFDNILSKTSQTSFLPSQISGLQLWLYAGSLGLSDGASVSSWVDSSGSGNTVSQATGANQPIFKSSVFNGLPAVRFNGSSSILTTTSWTYNASNVVFIVWCPNALSNSYTTLFDTLQSGSASAYAEIQYMIKSSGQTATYFAGSSSVHNYDGSGHGIINPITSSSYEIPYLSTFLWTTNFLQTIINGNIDASLSFSDTVLTSTTSPLLSIGGSTWNSSRILSGDIAEIIVYNTMITPSQLNQVQSYLMQKYCIP